MVRIPQMIDLRTRPTVRIIKGNIAHQKLDAVVNAANTELWMGSGVAGALKEAGGQIVEDEAVAQGPIGIGGSVITTGGDLRSRFVIHAAAMGKDQPQSDDESVYSATSSALRVAEDNELYSIGLPALGTGVGGYSLDDCAREMLYAVENFRARRRHLREVHFILYNNEARDIFRLEASRLPWR